ncbi:hypothetical protein A2642_02780 [Candidatus Nomurabacteria bacterium RIFCSPHIGHO2_01_FULL_39_10]|uniref:Uncharacterized protein n=1 Tax=Candidatus Nomurabacteria bacterium RIFCSPHIGHO2_01_FULL_39_10 TaxID=1801733 RepID=A0A1F6VAL1_9BACT|nr:MAG: hypothetical protein A2642_02780 [Candidatus Nomurabacteria bacterium RIFCSPHIGHO2_01_FULL_39_10]
MNTVELDLVKPTEYEELMTQVKLQHDKFLPVFQTTEEAVIDILHAYGYIQWTQLCPNRPMPLQEFLILNKGGYTFFGNNTNDNFSRFIKRLVVFSWDWGEQTIDVEKFVSRFQERLHSLIPAIRGGGCGPYLHCLIPPNFEELLQQVLEYRKEKK